MKGKLGTTFVTNDTIQASTTPSSQWTTVKGQVTGNTITPAPASALSGSTMTVKAAALTVTVSSQPVAQTIIAGANQFSFAQYIFDASQSGEDVRVTSIPLYFDTNGTRTDLTNCQLYDGSSSLTTGSNIKNPGSSDTASSTSFTFDGSGVVISKGTSKTLALKCNLRTGVSGSLYWWGLDTAQATNFTGASGITSGQTVAESLNEANGQIMTAATGGSYTVSNDTSSTYNYRALKAGTSGVTLGALKFTAGISENITLKQVAFALGNTSSNSPSDLVGQKVTLWSDGVQVGSAQFGLSTTGDFATSSPLMVVIPKGDTKTIVIKGDLTAQDAVNGTPGAFLAVNYDGDNNGLNGNYATGNDSGSTISGTTSDITTNGGRIFRNVPTFSVISTGGTLGAGLDLYKFRVTNPDATRDLALSKVTFSIATTGSTATGFILYGDGVAANSSVDASGSAGSQIVEITFTTTSNAKTVPAGSSKDYVLKASTVTVVTAAPATDYVNLALLSDTSYPSLTSLMGTVAGVEANSAAQDNIIWSPFSTTTPAADAASESNLDWTNGYGLPGFPSVGQDFPVQSWSRTR